MNSDSYSVISKAMPLSNCSHRLQHLDLCCFDFDCLHSVEICLLNYFDLPDCSVFSWATALSVDSDY